jgi:hypothetical protein
LDRSVHPEVWQREARAGRRARVLAARARDRRDPAVTLPEPGRDDVTVRTLRSGVSRGTETLVFKGVCRRASTPLCGRHFRRATSRGRSSTATSLFGLDEVIVSMLPARISRWLRLDVAAKVAALGLPVMVVTKSEATADRVPA